MIRSFAMPLILLLIAVRPILGAEWQKLMIGERLVVRAEVVSSAREQMLGLGNRESLPEGSGMLFVYDRPGERIFWMKGMRFPIDILWIRDGRITHIEAELPPPSPMTGDRSLKRYGRGVSADMVLELPAGTVAKYGITPGQTVYRAH